MTPRWWFLSLPVGRGIACKDEEERLSSRSAEETARVFRDTKKDCAAVEPVRDDLRVHCSQLKHFDSPRGKGDIFNGVYRDGRQKPFWAEPSGYPGLTGRGDSMLQAHCDLLTKVLDRIEEEAGG